MSVKMYNFNKAGSNFDKGNRDDESVSVLAVGQVLSFGLSEFTYEGDNNVSKCVFREGMSGFVECNSVVDMILNPSHNQSAGYGCKISKVHPHASTLYSYMRPAALESLKGSADTARKFSAEQADRCTPIAKCVDGSRYSLYGNVNPTAKVVDIREDLDFVRVECPRGSGATPLPGVQAIDVAFKDLLTFTNCPGDMTSARTLVELAIASGSLFMFVTFDDYNSKQEPLFSAFRGVPLIDANGFLAPVEESQLDSGEESVSFAAPWNVPQDRELSTIGFCVGTTPKTQSAEESFVPPPCSDLSLVSTTCAFEKGYKVYVGNPGSGAGNDSFYVLGMYFNCGPGRAGQPGAGGGGQATAFKRVRVTM
jgi:hypothetical protein